MKYYVFHYPTSFWLQILKFSSENDLVIWCKNIFSVLNKLLARKRLMKKRFWLEAKIMDDEIRELESGAENSF